MGASLSGTKEVIFDAAIKLASMHGFEKITMRDIALDVGIKASSIYYYYVSKNEILDNIYQYFLDHFYFSKKPMDELKELVKICTPEELVYAIHYDFSREGEKNHVRMSLITKIIYMRIFIDSKAKDIFLNILTNSGVQYVREIIEYGIEIGRIEPINAATFADCLNGQLNMMGMKAFSDPEYIVKPLKEEDRIKNLFASMLQFK